MTEAVVCSIADDDQALRLMLTEFLEEAGFTVVVASDGSDAARILDSPERSIAALITDIRMPHLDGWHLARHAREIAPVMPIIYMSGDSAAEWNVEGVPNSVMLAKPFAGAQLVNAVSTLLNRVQASVTS